MDQLAFPGADPKQSRRKKRSARKVEETADTLGVARVIVDLKTAAVDREFDYSVPARLAAAALPGCRVRVRFGHRLVNAFIVERSDSTDHAGQLTPLKAVLGPQVLTPATLQLARGVAHRYAGTVAEVLRDAVPARLAAAESSTKARLGPPIATDSPTGPTRVSLTLPTTVEPARELLEVISKHESAVVVVPNQRAIDEFFPVLAASLGSRMAVLNSNDSPYDRYQAFLNVINGNARYVLGTRNAVFAPVRGNPLVVVWNDGDDSLAEPRSPGWHAREVAALRSHQSGCPLVIAGFVQTVEVARLVETGWMRQVRPTRVDRQQGPAVRTAADQRAEDATSSSRIPHFAWDVMRSGLQRGPVLVQVARSGYIPAMACQTCGHVATCSQCAGSLSKDSTGDIACQWCGRREVAFVCPDCDGTALRAIRVGSSRTAEELQSAFPKIDVTVSGGQVGIIDAVGREPRIVVSTPGAEPRADGGYSAILLLDGDALLARSDLRTEEQTLRRWFSATSLVRDRVGGGVVAITANPRHRCVQALVRADPTGWARTEYLDRQEAQLPPSVRSASFSGPPDALAPVISAVGRDQKEWRVLGPVTTTRRIRGVDVESARSVVLVPMAEGQALADRISAVRRNDKSKAAADALRIRMDPLSLSADP